jgi:UDP-glucuronate 4-epimerase
MKILLTGCAGFIGSHTLDRLLADGHHVIGVDNFDPFYSRSLKAANIAAHLSDDLEGAKVGTCVPSEATRPDAKRTGTGENVNEPSDLPTFRPCHASNAGPPSNLNTFPPSNTSNAGSSHAASTGSFELLEADLAEETTYTKLKFLIGDDPVDAIIHLAAKAGVRPSIEDPVGYQRANVIATQNLLEFAKENEIKQFVFASSSSVYGVNPNVPWSEEHNVSGPISPYASTKVSCELLGHVYSHLYGIRVLGLRFFTVYGPRQRPDLAINKFVRLIEAGKPIPVFGDGSTRRDYTYIADIVEGILASVYKSVASGAPVLTENGQPKTEQPDGCMPSYAVINLGNDQTVTLSQMIETIEEVVGKKAIIDRQPEQPGDVPQTWADVSKANKLFGYKPSITFKQGVEQFYKWQKAQRSF